MLERCRNTQDVTYILRYLRKLKTETISTSAVNRKSEHQKIPCFSMATRISVRQSQNQPAGRIYTMARKIEGHQPTIIIYLVYSELLRLGSVGPVRHKLAALIILK